MTLKTIPPRIKEKKGFFGTFSNKSVGITALAFVVGIIIFFIFQNVIGILIAVALVGSAFLLFIAQDKYGENNEEKLKRQRKFNNSQKLYYYYRSTNPFIYNTKDPNKLITHENLIIKQKLEKESLSNI